LQWCCCRGLHRAAPFDARTANPAHDVYWQTSCHIVNGLKPLCSFSRLRQGVNYSDTRESTTGPSAAVFHVNKCATEL
jgi:hypothetical protein